MSVGVKPKRKERTSAFPESDGRELPEGWTSGRLDSIADLNPRHPSGLDDTQLVTFLPMPCVSASSPDFDRSNERPLTEVRKGYTHFADGDVLFAKITPCMENGKGAVATGLKNGIGCGTTELHVVRPLGGINPHYVYRFLQQESVRRDAAANFTGSAGQLRTPLSFISELELPLPPLMEQRRIVSKLELLLGKVSSSQQRLSRVPGLLKRFRQSVLAAACSGKLTADWREENETNQTGDVLLSSIKIARLKLANMAKEKNQIEAAFDPTVPDVTDEELGFDTLPETWTKCRIGAVGSVGNGSTPSRPQQRFWDGDIPWVSSGEVRNNLITNTRERITKAGFDGTSVRLLPRGTVLVAMIGEGKTRGQSAILQIEATINQNIAAVVISHGLVDSTFLWRWFQMRYEATREEGAGSGPQALNCQRVRELPFVLPPLAEQQEIVRRVEKLFAFADQIEARLKQAQTHVDRLTQSLLAKAFRGELVPTEAELARREHRDYEPASALLTRIRNEQTPTVGAKKALQRKRRGTPS